MKLIKLKYEDKDDNQRQAFVSSADAASKMSAALKASGEAQTKPTRETIDVPTTKDALLVWLNANASYGWSK